MTLLAKTHSAQDFAAAQEYFHSRNWTDGLPVVPPTVEAVQAMLDWVAMPANELIGIEPVRQRAITSEKLAINAVMAGCLPLHFPVVVTAVSAILQEEFLLHGVMASTSGAGIFVVINGPVRREIDASASFSVLGSSDRATSAIGRAIRLALINILDCRPGQIDRSTLGHPGKITYCIAEDEEESSWPSLAESRGIPPGVSAVTVFAAGAPRQIMNEWTEDPAEILDTFAAEMRNNQLTYSIYSGNYAIVVPKQLRTHFEAARWGKADVAQYLFEQAKVRRRDWMTVGKQGIVGSKGDEVYPALSSPEHLLLIAAGGPAGGFGAVIPPQRGEKSLAVTLPVGACVDCG